jgi:hypothetical protein
MGTGTFNNIFFYSVDKELGPIKERDVKMEDMETAEPDSTTVNSKVNNTGTLFIN